MTIPKKRDVLHVQNIKFHANKFEATQGVEKIILIVCDVYFINL